MVIVEVLGTTTYSTGKDHESVASIVTSTVGTSDNAAPDCTR